MSFRKRDLYVGKSTSFFSEIASIHEYRAFSTQISTTNGVGLACTCELQVSNNYDEGWVTMPNTSSSLAGPDDTHMYDIVESAAGFARVKITITTGSSDFRIDWLLK